VVANAEELQKADIIIDSSIEISTNDVKTIIDKIKKM